MNPCVELCFQRYGKQYSPECDIQCDYAKAVLENRELKRSMVHGKWLVNKEDGYISVAPCSVCGVVDDTDYKFCPNCGAKDELVLP